MTHQPRTMFDPQVGTLEFFWDANGNLAQMIGCKQNLGRLHEWDEENRLRFVLGDKHAGYYGYDATVTAYFAPCVEEALEALYETSTAIKILRDDKTYTVIGQEVK